MLSLPQGIRTYYLSKIDELELTIRERTQNLQRLKAQRNEWNAKGESMELPRGGPVNPPGLTAARRREQVMCS